MRVHYKRLVWDSWGKVWMIRGQIILRMGKMSVVGIHRGVRTPVGSPRRQIEAQLDPVGGSTTRIQHYELHFELYLMSRIKHYALSTMHYALFTMHKGGRPPESNTINSTLNSTWWAEFNTMHSLLYTMHFPLCTKGVDHQNPTLWTPLWTPLDEQNYRSYTMYYSLCTMHYARHYALSTIHYGGQPP